MSHAHRHATVKRLLSLVPEPCPNCEEPECDCSDDVKEAAELRHCPGITNRRTGRHERCAWVEKSDWMGDPSIPRGTVSWSFAKCLACGAEMQKPYPAWLEAKLPEKECY